MHDAQVACERVELLTKGKTLLDKPQIDRRMGTVSVATRIRQARDTAARRARAGWAATRRRRATGGGIVQLAIGSKPRRRVHQMRTDLVEQRKHLLGRNWRPTRRFPLVLGVCGNGEGAAGVRTRRKRRQRSNGCAERRRGAAPFYTAASGVSVRRPNCQQGFDRRLTLLDVALARTKPSLHLLHRLLRLVYLALLGSEAVVELGEHESKVDL